MEVPVTRHAAIALFSTCLCAGCIPPEWLEPVQLVPDGSVAEVAPPTGDASAVGSIAMVVPPGWRTVALRGYPDVTLLRPYGVDDSAVQLGIPPGDEFRGNLAEWAQDTWRALHYAKVGERIERGQLPSGQQWVMITAQLHTGLEGHKAVVFQALAEGTRVQPLFWYFRDQESLERYGADVDRITRSIRFLPPSERPDARGVPLDALVPRACPGCVHTFTGAPPTTPSFLLGVWATGTVAAGGGSYEDSRVYTFRADGSYEFNGAIRSGGVTAVLVNETGRYTVDGNQLTLSERSSDGPRPQPRTSTYEWRPALQLGTMRPMLVLRASPDEDWEGFFPRGR
jgi:hypothetical protein